MAVEVKVKMGIRAYYTDMFSTSYLQPLRQKLLQVFNK